MLDELETMMKDLKNEKSPRPYGFLVFVDRFDL
jgi:hypothetical protein